MCPPPSRGFLRLREPIDTPLSLPGWLKAQTGLPRLYWHARERDREFAGLGTLREIRSLTDLPALSGQSRPAEGSWPRYYGGVSFDPAQSLAEASHWQEFGHCRFVLPRIELVRDGDQLELICNLWLTGDPAADRLDIEHARQQLQQLQPATRLQPIQATEYQREDSPSQTAWRESVQTLTTPAQLQRQPKVVLARETRLRSATLPNPWDLLAALQPLTPACFHFAFQFSSERVFLGGTPERLYRRDGLTLQSEALAGTIVRTGEAVRDAELAAALLTDNKNRLENQLVQTDILTRLDAHADNIEVSAPRILSLRRLQHLRCDIHAHLRERISDAALLATLHPTPAVGGAPREQALTYLRQHEPFHRGWYAGACGLLSEEVSEFAVAIRSLLLEPGQLRLYAGAGILQGSQADAEWQELNDKLANLLGLLTRGSD